jgi:anthranilate synthase/aminodeoxychorismate synthase-like glutamine amidotransferase
MAKRARRVLVIDNYDSFTFNLVQYLRASGAECVIQANDAVGVEGALAVQAHGLLISPGPGTPRGAGQSLALIRGLAKVLPILGVCLGHQAIGEAFGAVVGRAPAPVHGKTSAILHDGRGVFRDLRSGFAATRYHSLVVERSSLPAELAVSAETDDGLIMGLRHRDYPIEGVQFHPESILTEQGDKLVQNWLDGL